ncbi:hypothetical protein DdX_15277 [Ditylenchus destructor]|uniref:Uncharacterized protein n=1 Tax=Ditylenchus destructor TaxID=166010 RepID=A0AAD4R167_9BILA|nr:hypothetical protein DdX_15277 [Ditylenchus destructor]
MPPAKPKHHLIRDWIKPFPEGIYTTDGKISLTLSQNLEVLVEVKTAISNAGGHIGQKIQTKLDFVMQKILGSRKW